MDEIITLDHGSGGLLTSQLIDQILVPAFRNPALESLGDGAVLPPLSGQTVFSTDSFVVTPWRFPGGDIGKLAVCGTVNDVCMAGGSPGYLSLSFIIEEGFLMKDFIEVVSSISHAAQTAGVSIVTGDTKVVERGKGDGIYINTAGIGVLKTPGLTPKAIRPGDAVLVSGDIGRHGAAVLMARGELPLEGVLQSDCMPLHRLSQAALDAGKGQVRVLRDPTRGGAATTLNEFVEGTDLCIELEENLIPLSPEVSSVCDLLGLDPLYVACEGRMVLVTAPQAADPVLNALRNVPGGEGAAQIGVVSKSRPGTVVLRTRLGGSRILGKLTGAQLPRIC